MTSSQKSNKTVIVFGSTGAIGRHLIQILAKKQPTWIITAVTRSTTDKFAHLDNVKVVKGDALDRSQAMVLSADKDIIFSCIGFVQYEAKYWAKNWPVVVDNLLAASSQQKGQKFIFCDNLYAYGATTNISPSTTSTIAPGTRTKPAVRALIRQKFEQRMNASPESMVVVGGADFFGPYVTNLSFMGDTFTKAILEKKTAPICIGSSSAIHDFAYAPDFAMALYITSTDDRANGKFWICPHAVHNKSLKQIAMDIGRLSKSDNTKVTAYPGWSVRLLSPFMGFMKEMVEMLPFWSKDYSVDDSDFVKTFGMKATPYEEALDAYIRFYKEVSLHEHKQEQSSK